MNTIRNWKIRDKLFVSFGIVLFFLILICGYFYYSSFAIQKEARKIEIIDYSAISHSSDMVATLLNIQYLFTRYIKYPREIDLDNLDIYRKKIYTLINDSKKLFRERKDRLYSLGVIEIKFDNFYNTGIYVLNNILMDNNIKKRDFIYKNIINVFERDFLDVFNAIDDYRIGDLISFSQSIRRMDAVIHDIRQISGLLAMIAIAAAVVIGIVLTRFITGSLNQIVNATQNVAAGNFSKKVPV